MLEKLKIEREIKREIKTIKRMVHIYCRKKHNRDQLCAECGELLEYAEKRIRNCRFRDNKPACAGCTVHCFKPSERERVREVMAFSGRFMAHRHPVLAFFHFLKKFRKNE